MPLLCRLLGVLYIVDTPYFSLRTLDFLLQKEYNIVKFERKFEFCEYSRFLIRMDDENERKYFESGLVLS